MAVQKCQAELGGKYSEYLPLLPRFDPQRRETEEHSGYTVLEHTVCNYIHIRIQQTLANPVAVNQDRNM
jgi:hypothetical protein